MCAGHNQVLRQLDGTAHYGAQGYGRKCSTAADTVAESVVTKGPVPVPSDCRGRVLRHRTGCVCRWLLCCGLSQGCGCGHKQCPWHVLHVVLRGCCGRVNHEGESLPHRCAQQALTGAGKKATPSWCCRCMHTLVRAWTDAVARTSMLTLLLPSGPRALRPKVTFWLCRHALHVVSPVGAWCAGSEVFGSQ